MWMFMHRRSCRLRRVLCCCVGLLGRYVVSGTHRIAQRGGSARGGGPAWARGNHGLAGLGWPGPNHAAVCPGAEKGPLAGLLPAQRGGHGFRAQRALPAMGSAFKNKGVQPLLDAVIDYLPDPRCVDAMGTGGEFQKKLSRRLTTGGVSEQRFMESVMVNVLTSWLLGSCPPGWCQWICQVTTSQGEGGIVDFFPDQSLCRHQQHTGFISALKNGCDLFHVEIFAPRCLSVPGPVFQARMSSTFSSPLCPAAKGCSAS